MPDFAKRCGNLEIMDDLACQGEVVYQTLRELDQINKWLGGNRVTLNGIQCLLRNQLPDRTICITDLGCGSGDMLRRISAWAQKKRLKINLIGVDANPHIIEFARSRSMGSHNVTFVTINVLTAQFQERMSDIILATLFTHHFPDSDLGFMLKSLLKQTRIGIIINDIHRHWFAYYSILLITRLFSKSAMVQYDAPLSVLRAFRRHDWKRILYQAGIRNFTIRWKWAFRWQLIIPVNQQTA